MKSHRIDSTIAELVLALREASVRVAGVGHVPVCGTVRAHAVSRLHGQKRYALKCEAVSMKRDPTGSSSFRSANLAVNIEQSRSEPRPVTR
jgi:hypothetical protein